MPSVRHVHRLLLLLLSLLLLLLLLLLLPPRQGWCFERVGEMNTTLNLDEASESTNAPVARDQVHRCWRQQQLASQRAASARSDGLPRRARLYIGISLQ
jgi:uncharacterized protein YhdP